MNLDLLAWCEDALATARAEAAAAVDRAQALADLRSLALERAAVLETPTLTLQQFEASLSDEEARARFGALARRIHTDQEESRAAA